MFARIYSGGLQGVDAYRIEVEVDCGGGIGQIQIVGLPDAAVKESQERVRSAIKACSFLMPPAKKWIVNMAPADTRKEGPAYDLPIATGILASSGMIRSDVLAKLWLVGELGLDGSVRPVQGVLPLAMAAKASGAHGIVVPEANADEAALVEGVKTFPVSHLKQVCALAEDVDSIAPAKPSVGSADHPHSMPYYAFDLDYKDVKGQHAAVNACTIAAAGQHNLLMVGPPGSGKSMLAQRLPTIMPPLTFDESLELTKLYSVAGLLNRCGTLVTERPFRSPHHSASAAGLIGGGFVPRPGEISLSHYGILFLDELTEFARTHLDNLRQPLESGTVTICRAHQTLTYPASFLLVGACNPCPCGYRGDGIRICSCTPAQADRYWSRLSGPLLDRIDLHVEVKRLQENELAGFSESESSESLRLKVLRAVDRQKARSEEGSILYNSRLNHRQLMRVCKLSERSRSILAQSVTALGMSARAYDRILRIARTIADLNDSDDVKDLHIAEAIRYKTVFRPNR